MEEEEDWLLCALLDQAGVPVEEVGFARAVRAGPSSLGVLS